MPTSTSPVSEVIQRLRSLLLLPNDAELTDGQLLECVIRRSQPAALEMLVRRHGPMVWGVCRRILNNHHDAEDAFQATFLIFVRKATSIRTHVGNWLYGVAQRTAMKARATRTKRWRRDGLLTGTLEPAAPEPEKPLWSDLRPLLDRELTRLPEKYRTVIVLCDLEGKSRRDAALELGCAEGTVASRLFRARQILAKRLARHGPAVPAGALATVLTHQASACVPASAMSSTIKAATLVATGQATVAASSSAAVAALTKGVMRAMLLNKLLKLLTIPLVLGGLSGAAGLIYHTWGTEAAAQAQNNDKAPKAAEAAQVRAVIDKAIKAQGGAQNLAKQKIVRQKGTGRRFMEDSPDTLAFSWEQVTQQPDRLKNIQEMESDGQKMSMTMVLKGDRAWVSMSGQINDMDKEMTAGVKEDLYADRVSSLLPLSGREYRLSLLAEVTLSGRPAVGVKVAAKGHRDIKLYFDRDSGLLVKREQRLTLPTGGEVTQEEFFSDYKETDGLKVYRKQVTFLDGKKIAEMNTTEIRFLDKISDKEFDRPASADSGEPLKNDADEVRKRAGTAIRQDGLARRQADLEKRIKSAPARAMKQSGLAGAMGGAHVEVLSAKAQEILMPMPQLADGQVPLSFFIRSIPPDAATEFRLYKGEEGNTAILVRLAGKKQDVRIAWSSVVLLGARSVAGDHASPKPYLKATGCVQAEADEITKLAAKIWPDSGKREAFALNIQRFISDMKPVARPRSLDALATLKSGENSICTGNANLAAALMRSKGIACRSLAVIPTIAQELEMHRIVEFSQNGRWLPFDPSSLDYPAKPWQNIIMARTTPQDEQRAMRPRMGVSVGCPYGQEIELLTLGVTPTGQNMFWTMAKPLAEFESTAEAGRLARACWTRYLETGVLTPGQFRAGDAKTAGELVRFLASAGPTKAR
jgi:RNA polymerase sigma factor (sigma-70 family)